MNIWFLIWLGLSGALLYFLGWTLYILFRQKNAWRAFAAKTKLRYNAPTMTGSPELSGILNGYTVSLFSGEHISDDSRGTRKLTAIEIQISSRIPFDAAIASGGMVKIARGLGLKEEMRPQNPAWNDSWIAASNVVPALEVYLSADRLSALCDLMKMKNTWVILIFRADTALLRLDTPDPLDDAKKIGSLMKKITDAAAVLELKPGEEGRLKQIIATRPVRVGKIDAKKETAGLTLALEDEESGDAQET